MSELHQCLLRASLREKLGVTGKPSGKLTLVRPVRGADEGGRRPAVTLQICRVSQERTAENPDWIAHVQAVLEKELD